MKCIEVADAEQITRLLAENTRHIEGKAEQSSGEKKVEAAKKFVLDWVKEHRDIDVTGLKLGEGVTVQIRTKDGLKDVFRITRENGGNKIDVKLLESTEPTVADKYRRQAVNTVFKSVPQ